MFLTILLIQLTRFISIPGYDADPRFFQQPCNVIRYNILDTAVTGTNDAAAFDHVPDCNMIPKQECFLFFDRGGQHISCNRSKHFPETILRMSVIKMLLSGFYRWESAKDQYFRIRIVNRLKCMCKCFVLSHDPRDPFLLYYSNMLLDFHVLPTLPDAAYQ